MKISKDKGQPGIIYVNQYSLPECKPFPNTVTLCKKRKEQMLCSPNGTDLRANKQLGPLSTEIDEDLIQHLLVHLSS